MMKRPQTTSQIADALRKGGIHSTAKSFVTTVYTTLSRQGDMARVGDKWTLREWHPSLRGVKAKPQATSDADTETKEATGDEALI